MDPEGKSKHAILERLLVDKNAEPVKLPVSLLEDITNRFSPDNQIGIGGFAVVYKVNSILVCAGPDTHEADNAYCHHRGWLENTWSLSRSYPTHTISARINSTKRLNA